jgi:hypothetical protein
MGYSANNNFESLHLFPGHPWLSIIKSKAYNILYSTGSLKKTDAELLRDVMQIDDELEQWRLSIPVSHRPTLTFNQEALHPRSTVMLSVMLHLDYNHCVSAIHQATSRCQTWDFDDQDDASGVGSSLRLAVEASRSSLIYLQKALNRVDHDSFWYVNFSPLGNRLWQSATNRLSG